MTSPVTRNPNAGTIQSFESLTKAQTQITSGNVALNIREAPEAAKAIMVDSSTRQWSDNKIMQLEQTNIDAGIREATIEQLIESATRIAVIISQANTDTNGSNVGFKDNMNNEMEAIFGLLNTKNVNGDYLFAGSALKTKPADRNSVVNPSTAGSAANFSWFKGLDDADITARRDGIEKIIRAAQMAYTSSMGPPSDHARLTEAARILDQGITETSDSVLAKTITIRTQIEKGIDSWQDARNTADNQISSWGQTSTMEKIMEIQNRNMQLQGDFIAKAEIRDAMKALISSIRG